MHDEKNGASFAETLQLLDKMTCDLSDDALKVIAKLIQEQLCSCNLSESDASSATIRLSASA